MKAFVKIEEMDFSDSPIIESEIATGRATCRICGEKIEKGVESWSFYFSTTEGGSYNPWTAITGHAHKSCCHKTKERK